MGVSTARPLPSHRHLGHLAIIVVIALTLALTALATSAQAQPGATLGVYAGAGAPNAVGAFESRLGRPVSVVHDTLAKESWGSMTDIGWWLSQWGATKYAERVVYTVPMLPNSGGTLAEGAAGAYNVHFRLLAEKMVAGGQGGATLRIGPEFNGNWFKWTIAVPNGGADFAAYWRQIVTTMRSVAGANFKFDWSPNAGSSYVAGQPLQAESAWPGDGYVDYVGADIYDQSWAAHRADPVARWNEYLNAPNGLRWHRDFAAAHNKAMTFPEWGIANRSDGYGGGDAPYFIEQMYEWIRTNNVAYSMYFEYADDVADYAIFAGRTPNAAQRLVQLFGSGATGAPLASLPSSPTATTTAIAAGTQSARPRTATRRCSSRVVRTKGKVVRRNGKVVRRNGKVVRTIGAAVRRNGKVVRRTICSTVAKKRCASRVVRRNGKVVRKNGKAVRTTTCVTRVSKRAGSRKVAKRGTVKKVSTHAAPSTTRT